MEMVGGAGEDTGEDRNDRRNGCVVAWDVTVLGS